MEAGEVISSPGMIQSASAIKVLGLIRLRKTGRRIYSVKSVKALVIFVTNAPSQNEKSSSVLDARDLDTQRVIVLII